MNQSQNNGPIRIPGNQGINQQQMYNRFPQRGYFGNQTPVPNMVQQIPPVMQMTPLIS
jgi:hypothetical protein